jgi:hypothetical protein
LWRDNFLLQRNEWNIKQDINYCFYNSSTPFNRAYIYIVLVVGGSVKYSTVFIVFRTVQAPSSHIKNKLNIIKEACGPAR